MSRYSTVTTTTKTTETGATAKVDTLAELNQPDPFLVPAPVATTTTETTTVESQPAAVQPADAYGDFAIASGSSDPYDPFAGGNVTTNYFPNAQSAEPAPAAPVSVTTSTVQEPLAPVVAAPTAPVSTTTTTTRSTTTAKSDATEPKPSIFQRIRSLIPKRGTTTVAETKTETKSPATTKQVSTQTTTTTQPEVKSTADILAGDYAQPTIAVAPSPLVEPDSLPSQSNDFLMPAQITTTTTTETVQTSAPAPVPPAPVASAPEPLGDQPRLNQEDEDLPDWLKDDSASLAAADAGTDSSTSTTTTEEEEDDGSDPYGLGDQSLG